MLIFTNPAFLWALTATAIPLMLHMFQRRRTVVTPFPTLRFLKAAQKRSSSRVRFENFLLWLLRTLLLLLLVIAFAMPVIRTTTAGSWLSRTRRDIAIVLDASYSMNYELERGTVWDICRDTAVTIIEGLLPGDRVCVYLAGETIMPLIEKPTAEHATVVQAIRSATPQYGRSFIDKAVVQAVKSLTEEPGKQERELYILSDGQSLAWHGFSEMNEVSTEPSTETGITREQRDSISMFVLNAGARTPENCFPVDVRVSPQMILAGQSTRLNVTLGCSGASREIAVAVEVDGKERGKRSLSIDADAEATTEFVIDGLEPGVHICKVTTPPDALALDDEFMFLIRVREHLPALIAGNQRAIRYLRAALSPGAAEGSTKVVDTAELDSIDLQEFQAIFLCDALPLSGQAIMRIEQYAREGGVVVIFPGPQADTSDYQAMDILPAPPLGIQNVPLNSAARNLRRVTPQPEQKVVFSLALPPGAVPAIALKQVLQLGELHQDSATLIAAGDETPLLVGRAVGRGRVFLFTIAADRDWSTFPLTALFLPTIHQLMRQGAGASTQPPHVMLGTAPTANTVIPDYRLTDIIQQPAGTQLIINPVDNQIEEFGEPGIYTRNRGAGSETEPVMALNLDRRESNLTPVNQAELTAWTKFKKIFIAEDPEELEKLIDEYRNGRALAEMFLWFTLLVALIEWWYANRILRKKIGASENLIVDMAGKVRTR